MGLQIFLLKLKWVSGSLLFLKMVILWKTFHFGFCLEKQMFGKNCIHRKHLHFNHLEGWPVRTTFLFIVNFSGFFHLLLPRQAFTLGWLLSLLSSGLWWSLVDLGQAQFSVFYFVSAPMTRSDSWSWWWAFILFLAESLCAVVVRCSYLLMIMLNLLLNLFSSNSITFIRPKKTFIQWQLGHFIAGTA